MNRGLGKEANVAKRKKYENGMRNHCFCVLIFKNLTLKKFFPMHIFEVLFFLQQQKQFHGSRYDIEDYLHIWSDFNARSRRCIQVLFLHFPQHQIEKVLLSNVGFEHLCQKLRWLWLCGFISKSFVFFPWSTYLFCPSSILFLLLQFCIIIRDWVL